MPLNAKLVVVGGEVKTAEIKLRLPSTVGRGRGASIMLPHPLVSRQHCELFEDGGRLMVRDLGSLNGTFINNERISEAALPSGELLTIGAVTFRAVYEPLDSSASSAETPPQPQATAADSGETDLNRTVRSVPSPPAVVAKMEEAPLEDDADFNFDEPLTPVDEDARLPSPQLSQPDAEALPLLAPGAAAGAKTTPLKSPPPPKQAASPESKTEPTSAEFSKWDQEEDIKPEGASDDDFNDFLKSLETK